ncbi:PDR/VanB family oxidoreductase [Paenarthrobacter sp. NPDC058040]|uniref:PDR/VanB family oxidoreductase n=1 Tax=unclassified Paenarthrobacter TaxID=2634190 RepID=UPI0036D9D601
MSAVAAIEKKTGRRTVLVEKTAQEASAVLSLTLVDPEGGDLPEWAPGDHIDLILPSGLVRQYSLCGSLEDPRSYRVAVLRVDTGRGGSLEVHEAALEGQTIDIVGPRNNFALHPAPAYVFLAGGIGITPILPMIHTAIANGTPWTLYYGARTLEHMAFIDELSLLDQANVHVVPQDVHGIIDLAAITAAGPDSAQYYCCGPEPMIAAAEAACAASNPPRDLHVERFGAQPTSAAPEDQGDNKPFEVELAKTGKTLLIPADRSVLDVVRESVPGVLSSCGEGYCGTCETKVLAGEPDHRDDYLEEDERAAGTSMMICVSRARSSCLVLDL